MNAVATIRNCMSDAEYDAEKARLQQIYGTDRKHAGARYAQEMASFVHRSGWTQEKLAKKEGGSQQKWAYRLRFGRFLDFSGNTTAVVNLTERRFREYWSRTDQAERNERARFGEVQRLMIEETVLSRNQARLGIGNKIREHRFHDGEWHRLSTIVAKLKEPERDVLATLDIMCGKGSYGLKGEKKKVGTGNGTSFNYRFFPQDRTVSSQELTTKLTPIVEGLIAEGKKNMATMSPATVAHLADKIRKLLDEWAE